MPRQEVFDKLKEALLNYDEEATEKVAEEVTNQGLDPIEAIDILATALRELGDKYGEGEVALPELILAADAMKAGTTVLMEAIPADKKPAALGTFVIGTVKGDVHDIGKTITAAMLSAAGFNVVDVGKDVSPSAFAEAAKKNKADIVGTSAIMSTTIPMQREVIEYFEALGIRGEYKMMVGGGPCTEEYAKKIGADAYGKDAIEAAQVATKLMGK